MSLRWKRSQPSKGNAGWGVVPSAFCGWMLRGPRLARAPQHEGRVTAGRPDVCEPRPAAWILGSSPRMTSSHWGWDALDRRFGRRMWGRGAPTCVSARTASLGSFRSLRDKIGREYSRQSFAVSVRRVPVVSAPSPGCGFTLRRYRPLSRLPRRRAALTSIRGPCRRGAGASPPGWWGRQSLRHSLRRRDRRSDPQRS